MDSTIIEKRTYECSACGTVSVKYTKSTDNLFCKCSICGMTLNFIKKILVEDLLGGVDMVTEYKIDGKKYRKIGKDEIIKKGAMHSLSGGGLMPVLNNGETIGDKPSSFGTGRDFYNPIHEKNKEWLNFKIDNFIEQWKRSSISDKEFAKKIYNTICGPIPQIFRVDIICEQKIIHKAYLVSAKNTEEAIDTLKQLNKKEAEEGEPLFQVKPPYTLQAEPIEYTHGICEI